MIRRDFVASLGMGSIMLAASPSLLLGGCGAGSEDSGDSRDILRVIHSNVLSSLDPIFTSAPGTREYGFLTFDQLVSVDNSYVPHPQMAEGWIVEDDGRSYVFTLRGGLKFHDGEPVRSSDCIASIKRWGARDSFGQMLMKEIAAFDAIDDRKFRIRTKVPLPVLPAALGKSTAAACLMMPERMAKVDPGQQITEAIGSGPFRFLKDEWVPGSKAAWARFEGYVPRKESPNGLAGGHVARMKRIEWAQIPDASTAMAALQSGEQDFWPLPPADLLPVMAADPGITIGSRSSTDGVFMLQPNHQQPPFNNVAVRQALAMAIDQVAMMKSVAGDRPGDAHALRSFFPKDSPYYSEVGSEVLGVANVEKAKQALAASGYKGEEVVLLTSSDGTLSSLGQIIEDLLTRMGMKITLVALDFASMIQRRTNHDPVSKGGWSLFLTAWAGSDIIDPAVHPMLRGAGLEGYPGWCEDATIERLRQQWVSAPPAEQKAIAEQIQAEAFKVLPYIPLGSVTPVCAWRKNVSGVLRTPYAVYWNIGKSA